VAEVDQATASALGWPKAKYAWVERERRWLCRSVPTELVKRSERIRDLYVTGTRLRLREGTPSDGSPRMLRLGRKADVDASTRLLTSIYLAPNEFELLAGLPGELLVKTRHHLGEVGGATVSVDEFEGRLQGLVLAEAEFESDEAMAAYRAPAFAATEVTEDLRYTGGELVQRVPPTLAP
jgi:CYTH domain-containing protein